MAGEIHFDFLVQVLELRNRRVPGHRAEEHPRVGFRIAIDRRAVVDADLDLPAIARMQVDVDAGAGIVHWAPSRLWARLAQPLWRTSWLHRRKHRVSRIGYRIPADKSRSRRYPQCESALVRSFRCRLGVGQILSNSFTAAAKSLSFHFRRPALLIERLPASVAAAW